MRTLSYGAIVRALLVVILGCISSTTQADSGKLEVLAVQGKVTFSVDNTSWKTLTAGTLLDRGATIKTGAKASADLVLQYNGTALRLIQDSTLRLTKLDKEQIGNDVITETSLKLEAGALLGSQRKLQTPSRFDVVLADGVATIVGTEYVIRSDGAVSVLSGSVTINYNKPGKGGSVKVTIPAGYSFDPSTGEVVPTTPEYLTDIVEDISTMRKNAQVFKYGGATIVVRPEQTMSPANPRGNNGVSTGQGPQPPDRAPASGAGTSPGSPGKKG